MLQSNHKGWRRAVKAISVMGWVIASLSLVASRGGAQSHPGNTAPGPKGKTAGEVYKNIKVLNDIPASQLIGGMRYMTTALGVRCDFCHVNPFEKDDKREKQTARLMMKMLFEINDTGFGGRPEVSCYTCHRGHSNPVSIPALPAEAMPAPPVPPTPATAAASLPGVNELIDKYSQALGGEEAMRKISSRVTTARQIGENKSSNPQEIYQKGSNKVLTVTRFAQGVALTGLDGTNVWSTSPRGPMPVSDMSLIVSHREVSLDPAEALRHYADSRVLGRQKIGDQDVVLMRAKAPDGYTESIYFDADSGLLVRRSIRMSTVFGALPLQMDYSDFRKVDGVTIPFKTSLWTAEGSWSREVDEVKDNVPIEDSKFEKPVPPAGREK